MRLRWMSFSIVRSSVTASHANPRLLKIDQWPDRTPRSSMIYSAAAKAASKATFTAASRIFSRIALLFLLALLIGSSVKLHAQSAKAWYKQGQAAESREDWDKAFNAYQKAYSMAPKELSYKEAFYRVQIPAAGIHMKNGRRLFANGDE